MPKGNFSKRTVYIVSDLFLPLALLLLFRLILFLLLLNRSLLFFLLLHLLAFLFDFGLRNLEKELLLLESDLLLTPLPRLLILGTPRLRLLRNLFGSCIFALLLENELHQDSLVLEAVSFRSEVQFVIQMLIDFLRLSVFFEKTTKDSHASDPEDLDRHSGIRCSSPLAVAHVTSLSSCFCIFPCPSAGVDSDGFPNDETVLDQASDVLPGIGVRDLGDLIGIQPDLLLATLQNGGG